MKTIKHSLILWIFSVLFHLVTQMIVCKIIKPEFPDDYRYMFFISTIAATITVSYLFLRFNSNNQKPKFSNSLFTICVSQSLTITTLIICFPIKQIENFIPDTTAIALKFDWIDYLFKISVFSVGLPLILLPLIYLIDGRRTNNHG